MKVYFLCCEPGPPEKCCYQHCIIALAEGFKSLGIKTYGNINYWKFEPYFDEFLIQFDKNINPNDCDLVIFDNSFYKHNNNSSLLRSLFINTRKPKLIFIDASDGIITPGFQDELRSADLVLKTHYNKKSRYPRNFRPWQFGLTNRIIDAVKPRQFEQRYKKVLVNFRVEHTTRVAARDHFFQKFPDSIEIDSEVDSFERPVCGEKDLYYWEMTGRRHYPAYYEKLGKYAFCAAFGGYFEVSYLINNGRLGRFINNLNNKLSLIKPNSVYQFDSWRFWESMLSGCVTLHVDFDKYGCVFFQMPVNDIHYIGVDFSDINKSLDIIYSSDITSIGSAGRDWALNNYSPTAVTKRLLNWL